MASSEKVVSPGVFTNEIDQTFLPAGVGDIGAAVVGPTVRGPAGVPTQVGSYSEYQQIFGDVFESGSADYQYMTSLTAREYLKHGSALTVVRVLAGSYGGASVEVSSSIDPFVIGESNSRLTKGSGSLLLGGGYDAGTSSAAWQKDTIKFSVTSSDARLGAVTKVAFRFTGSQASIMNNTANEIWVVTSSRADGDANVFAASALRDAINNSQSLHQLTHLSASSDGAFTVGFTGSVAGETDVLYSHGMKGAGTDVFTFHTSSCMTGSFLGDQVGVLSSTLRYDGSKSTEQLVFKLHTHADGEILNSGNGVDLHGSTEGLLLSGSANNFRYEITSLNENKGTFSLAIRRGDDTIKKKQAVESWKNLSLDPNSNNYIAKVIGDQKIVLRGSGTDDPYLTLSGSYRNNSKYVRVEVLNTTVDYLDENGNLRLNSLSGSLPTFFSGSNSGSFGGSFSGGSDGTVQHPKNFYDKIADTNSQGLNLNVAGSGQDAYIDAIRLLGNQDEYDVNLILLPGVVDAGTGGGTILTRAIETVEKRGDAFIVADPVFYDSAITTATGEAEGRDSSYAAMYYPWVQINDPVVGGVWVPPSVVIAGVYAFNDRVGQQWFAPAGLNRGIIDSVQQVERKLTHSSRDTLYESNVNPIAIFPGQGVCVWGQKTLQMKASALDRVNVRRLLITLKKFIASTSRFLVFEQNNSKTRQQFLSIVNPYMEQVQSNSGLTAFRVVMDASNNTPDLVDRNILYGQIFVQPTRTAEFIVLDFTLQPTGATFPE
jgi:hypothetical protein